MKSILGGYSGASYSNSKTDPTVARLDSGAYTILGGNPNSEQAIDLIRQDPINVVTPENEIWEQLLYDEFKGKIMYQSFCKFSPSTLNREYLQRLAVNINSNYKNLRIDKNLANQLSTDINNNYFFEHFSSIYDFLVRGIGFCVKYNDKIVSAVTSMAAAEKMINVEIETHSEFRNKNFGAAVSANLLLYCLENGIEAQGLAANNISERLALKLGYSKSGVYKTFIIG